MMQDFYAFHDAGFLYTYLGHEEKGCQLAEEILPAFGIDEKQVAAICNMILSTKIPQSPQTLPEQIICDADLDYLGLENPVPVATALYEEIKNRGENISVQEWNDIQINFLQSHRYHTNYAKLYRQQNKNAYLQQLIQQQI